MGRFVTVFAVVAAVSTFFAAGTAFSKTQYSVFCANGKIEVDSRSLDQMKSARGSGTCLIKAFDYKMDADKHAGSLGGVGSSCKCK